MKFSYGLPAALIGAAVVVVQPQFVAALTTSEIARAITVRIDGPNTGSGVIVERKGNTYTVLTNAHVVNITGTYTIQTPDGQRYRVNSSVVRSLSGVDLAVLQFSSTTSYSVAELGDSDQLSEGTTVYVAGWADPDAVNPERGYRFPDGRISGRVQKPKEGYALVYSNVAKPGMSGGPVLNEQGRVVGINGLSVFDDRTGAPDFLGIPINTFVRLRAALDPPTALIKPLQTNEAWISQMLKPVPVFTITDNKGAPLVASVPNSQNQGRVAGVFISQRDAQAFLEQLKTKHPNLAKTVRVVPVSLAEVYKLDQANQNKPNSPDFQYIPAKQQVDAALALLRQSNQKVNQFNGTPLFVAKAGKEKGYLTINQANQQIIPFFFNKEDLQNMLDRFKQQQPNLASTVEIQVVNLEGMLQTLKTRNDDALKQIMLIPSRESIESLRRLIEEQPSK